MRNHAVGLNTESRISSRRDTRFPFANSQILPNWTCDRAITESLGRMFPSIDRSITRKVRTARNVRPFFGSFLFFCLFKPLARDLLMGQDGEWFI